MSAAAGIPVPSVSPDAAAIHAERDADIDGLDAEFLAAMNGQPWTVARVQANAGRSQVVTTRRPAARRAAPSPTPER